MTKNFPYQMKYFLMPTYGRYVRNRFKIKKEGFEKIENLDGPYIVLVNHVHVLDPFFVSSIYPTHIRWVAGSHLFKSKILNYVLTNWVKSISKQQGRSDMQTVNDIKNALKNNEIVGIFPEATRCWDGEPLPFDITTAKLCKIFKVPVVILNIKGAYGLKPRWTDKKRKGPLSVEVVNVIDKETVIATKAEELYKEIVSGLDFSHIKYVKENDLSYRGKELAQGLERILYLCPNCGARSTMHSHGNLVTCTTCSATNTIDGKDLLTSVDGLNNFETVALWHKKEKEMLLDILSSSNHDELIFPKDKGVAIWFGKGKKLITISKHFEMSVTKDYLRIIYERPLSYGKNDIVFDFDKIQSFFVNTKQSIEIFYDDILYRIQLNSIASTVKYQEIFENFKKCQNGLEKQS